MSIKGRPIGWPSVQADYAQTDTTAADYIKNKPDIQASANEALADAKDYVDAKKQSLTVTLRASSWSSKSQSVTANGVTTRNAVIVSPAEAYWKAYCQSGVYCSAQANNKLTFKCEDVPEENITVNVLILN